MINSPWFTRICIELIRIWQAGLNELICFTIVYGHSWNALCILFDFGCTIKKRLQGKVTLLVSIFVTHLWLIRERIKWLQFRQIFGHILQFSIAWEDTFNQITPSEPSSKQIGKYWQHMDLLPAHHKWDYQSPAPKPLIRPDSQTTPNSTVYQYTLVKCQMSFWLAPRDATPIAWTRLQNPGSASIGTWPVETGNRNAQMRNPPNYRISTYLEWSFHQVPWQSSSV